MLSKFTLPLLAAIAMTSPAVAQDIVYAPGTGNAYYKDDRADPLEPEVDGEASEVARRMSDPMLQDGVATTVESLAESIMRLPIGGLADTIERARPGTVDHRLPRNATVGDLAERDGRDLPRELGYRSREAMAMMGGFAEAFAAMLPEFRRMSREVEESLNAAKTASRRYRD